MITTKLYLDCRGVKDGSAAPLRLVITLNSLRAFLPLSTSLLPSQWDDKAQAVRSCHPRASLVNAFIQQQKVMVDSIILRLESEGRLTGLRANQIKDLVKLCMVREMWALSSVDDGVYVDELTSYWARHSWATMAALPDVPKETIAATLGHGGNSVTDIYIDFDVRKVHVANRRVLDYVLYGKEAPVI